MLVLKVLQVDENLSTTADLKDNNILLQFEPSYIEANYNPIKLAPNIFSNKTRPVDQGNNVKTDISVNED